MLLTTYLQNKMARMLATYIILASGNTYFLYRGKYYTEDEFEAAFPVNVTKIKTEKDTWKGDSIGKNSTL
jgi:hypothetical protein